jgi:thiol:disulfide interchange protein DsbD
MPLFFLMTMFFSTIISTGLPTAGYAGSPQVTAVTLSTPATDFSKPFTAVIHFTLSPEWYLYWTNPGDAGLPVAARWDLPGGFSAGPLRFPTPEKIVHEDIVAYGYFHELILLCTLTPPAGYRPAKGDSLRVNLDWLVCSESCVPGKTSITLALDAAPTGKFAAELADRFTRQAPGDLSAAGITVGPAHVTSSDNHVTLHIPLNGAIDDFYPEPIENVVIEHKRITVGADGITMPVTPYDALTVMKSISGIAIIRGKGYRLKTPIEYR